MTRITFVLADGTETTVETEDGLSVMHAALAHQVAGIVGECGGSAMCATCHVYISEHDLARIGPVGPVENELLEGTASERRPTSRLSCQIIARPELDGLTLEVPPEQF